MPTNVVRIEEIAECVQRTLDGINAGVVAARQAGMQVELPTEVKFSMVVVKSWQALDIQSGESGETTETQGGNTVEKSEMSEAGNTTQDTESTGHKAAFQNERQTQKLYSTET